MHRTQDMQLARCAGVYNETYFQGLDLALASAARHDVHVIITMGNNWCVRAHRAETGLCARMRLTVQAAAGRGTGDSKNTVRPMALRVGRVGRASATETLPSCRRHANSGGFTCRCMLPCHPSAAHMPSSLFQLCLVSACWSVSR